MIIDRPQPCHVSGLRDLWKEAFGDTDDFLDTFWKTAFSDDRCRCIIESDTVAAALYWFDCEYRGKKAAYLYAVATAQAFRGRGFCRALIENTNCYLEDNGYAASLLVPQEEGLRQMYENMGYRAATAVREFSCTQGKEQVDISLIDRDTYALLRRQLLPKGSVVQEQENLAFLQTQAKFFAGDAFLLVANGAGRTLRGLELLGDTSVAPAILNALGYESGEFRAPGEEKPFAMYRPLIPDMLPPEYFGLAFD